MNIKVLADSTSNLNKELAKKYNIEIIPTFVIADGKEVIDDGNLDHLKLYDLIDSSKSAKTSLPSPNFLLEAVERNKNYDHLLILHVASRLSGTYSATKSFVRQYKRLHPDSPEITVYDSKGTSFTLGTLAIKASQLIKEGYSMQELLPYLDNFRDNDVKVWLTVPDLKRLFDGGRVS
ncbi:MAG: DegV family protein, partial [Candidatus Heimdallarchaeaceae archaeon]